MLWLIMELVCGRAAVTHMRWMKEEYGSVPSVMGCVQKVRGKAVVVQPGDTLYIVQYIFIGGL